MTYIDETDIVLRVRRHIGDAIATKESVAMDMEKYGDVEVVSVARREPEQMEMAL